MRKRATVAGFGLIAALSFSSLIFAQGPPASVTSIGFGGHGSANSGVPAGVTSIGFGSTRPAHNPFFNQPACCINPLFPTNPNHHGNHRRQAFPVVGAYPVYYGYPAYGVVEPVDDTMEQSTQSTDEYRGGPTIFDRRGPGTTAIADRRQPEPAPRDETPAVAAPEPPPAADQPETVLVFKDGHQLQVRNYAIIGDTLVDMTDGHRRKVAIAELDLEATVKQNDDRGIDFRLPVRSQAN